jgi:hypothetical protein
MKESTRNEIVRLHYGGASQRRIAKLLGVARKSVARVLVGHEQHRAEPVTVERPRRPSVLDPFADHIANCWSAIPTLRRFACMRSYAGWVSIQRFQFRPLGSGGCCNVLASESIGIRPGTSIIPEVLHIIRWPRPL